MKRDFRTLTDIGTLLYKEKNKPVKFIENDFKNQLFPLSLFARKGSFLNKQTYDYLNSVSPKNLRGWTASPNTLVSKPKINNTLFNSILKNNETLPLNSPITSEKPKVIQKETSINTSPINNINYNYSAASAASAETLATVKDNDVIYEYLKTFSIFNKRKNGILIRYSQHIGYNFNSKNVLLRGVEPQTNKSLKINNKNSRPLLALLEKEPKINKVNTILREINRLKGVSGLTGYNRNANNRLIKYSYKLLFFFFKSMYCLISKPVFLFTPDKVTIQLFYFLNIPKFKVFKWYSIFNNNLIRQKPHYFAQSSTARDPDHYIEKGDSSAGPLSNLNDFSTSTYNNAISNSADTLTRNQFKTVLSYTNKEMMNKVKLSWRIKKTLFRLNKKRNKVKNILFNLNKFNLFKVFSLKFKLICEILSNKFKKPVELQLIRIHQPFHDSNILVNLLSLNIRNKKFKTNVAIERLYAKKAVKNLYDYSIKSVNFIPTFLSGVKIRIGGRLMREPIIPRITTKLFERGASSPGKVNFLDTATITKKNRKGSYTIKISSGQNFF
jgi:hypothetical protein